MNPLNLSQIAEILGCDPSNYSDKIYVRAISTLDDATEEMISFISSEKYKSKIDTSIAAAFIVPKGIEIKDKITFPVEEVWEGVLLMIKHLYPQAPPANTIDPDAVLGRDTYVGRNVTIERNVEIGKNTVIGDNVVINSNTYIGENVKIGNNVFIFNNCTVLRDVVIGNGVIIHSGAVIGSDGFKYEMIKGKRTKIPQIGTVVLEDDVEIGANTCIDRGSFTETRIGQGTKIDNLVHIAHNVHIGKNCLIIAQVGIAGSTKVGDNVILAGQVGVKDNVVIEDGAIVGAQGGVTKTIKAGQYVWGTPAVPMKEFIKTQSALKKLPDIIDKLNK